MVTPEEEEEEVEDGIVFTLQSQIRTTAGDSLPMNSLKIGDRIMTVKRSGEISYSPVISFMHYDTQKTGHFIQLQTENNHAVTLSPYHLIYKTDYKNMNATQLPAPVFAYEVREDDYLFVVPPDAASGTSTNIPTSRVVRVGVVHEKGVIAPLDGRRDDRGRQCGGVVLCCDKTRRAGSPLIRAPAFSVPYSARFPARQS